MARRSEPDRRRSRRARPRAATTCAARGHGRDVRRPVSPPRRRNGPWNAGRVGHSALARGTPCGRANRASRAPHARRRQRGSRIPRSRRSASSSRLSWMRTSWKAISQRSQRRIAIELEALGFRDRDGLRRHAVDRLRSDLDAWSGQPVFAYGFEDLTGAEWALLEALSARTDVTVSIPYEPGRAAFATLERTVDDLARLADGAIEELQDASTRSRAVGAGAPRARALLRRAGARAAARWQRFGSSKEQELAAPWSCSRANWRQSSAAGCLRSVSPSFASPSIAGGCRSRARSRSSASRTPWSTGVASETRRSAARSAPCCATPGSEAGAAISSRSCARRSPGSSVGPSTSSKAASADGPSPIPRALTRRASVSGGRRFPRSLRSGPRRTWSQPPGISWRSWCGTPGGSTRHPLPPTRASTPAHIEPRRGRSTSWQRSRPAASGSPPRTSWRRSSGRVFLRMLPPRAASPCSTTSTLGRARSTSSSCSGWRRVRFRDARDRRRS